MSTTTPRTTRNDMEVRVARTFSTNYKLEILARIDAATERGEVGRILRQEGLYSSLISRWRQQRDKGAFDAMNATKRGPKTNSLADENQRLREENERLKEKLQTAGELAEAQGKAFALLQRLSRESDNPK